MKRLVLILCFVLLISACKETCGNDTCGEGENKCNCAQDCGVCSGNAALDDRKKAEYIEYGCVENSCEMQVSSAKDLNVVSDKDTDGMTLGITTTIREPLLVAEDQIKVRFETKEIDEDTTDIVIEKVQILVGDVLFGEREVNKPLKSVSHFLEIHVPIEYSLDMIEQKERVRIKTDYQFMRDDTLTRRSFEYAPKRDVYFIELP